MVQAYGVLETNKTESKAEAHAEEIKIAGYTVLENYLNKDLLKKLDAAYLEVKQKDLEMNLKHDLDFKADQNLIRCPLAWNDIFIQAASLELPIEIIKNLLGDNIQLLMQNIITNAPGEVNHQAQWHRDLNYQHFVSSKPIALNFLIALDDFSKDNGATIALPGTHLSEAFPSSAYIEKHQVSICMPRGSVVIMNAMLYHRGGGLNSTNQARRGINHVVGRPFLAQQINIPEYLKETRQLDLSDDPFLGKYLGYRWSPAKNVVSWRQQRL